MSEITLPEYQAYEAPIKLTARQIALKDLLEKKSPLLGSMYYGALLTLHNEQNPDAVFQAAHSIRELIRRLPQIVPTLSVKPEKIDIIEKLTEIVKDFQSNDDLNQNKEWISKVSTLIDQSSLSHRLQLGELLDKCDQAGLPIKEKERAAKYLHELYTWFVNVCHHRESPTSEETLKQLYRLELILDVLFRPYFEIEPELTRLMDIEEPNRDHLNKVNSILIKRSLIEYWFNNLNNYSWLSLLNDAGYFKKPIDIITHEDGAISCPSWPQSSLLLKCADLQPELVGEILQEVEDTSNARVHQELVEVSLKLPANLVTKFAEKAKNWIRDRYYTITLLPVRLAELTAKLASEGESSVALKMADTILDVRIDHEKYENQKQSLGFSLALQTDAYVDDWHYEKLIETIEPSIFRVCPLDYLRLLCNKLSKAIRIEHKTKGDENSETDYTCIARPAIEDHEQNTGTDRLKDILINHIRNITVRLVQEGKPINDVINLLRESKYPIFKRLEIHLLIEFPEKGKEYITSLLKDEISKDLDFDNAPIRHELYRLLDKAFGGVSHDVQKKYYDWITAGPDTEHYRDTLKKEAGREPDQKEIESYIGQWKLKKYGPIKTHLDHEHKSIYKKLQDEYKIEDHPEFAFYRKSWVGPTSPIDAKELGQLNIEEVIEYLKGWKPEGRHFLPSPEGLGRVFKDDVKNRAVQYSHIADSINPKDIRPVYLHYFYSGLEDSLKDGKEIDWSRIITLSELIVLSNDLPESEKSGNDFETSWQGVRQQVASLFSEGLKTTNRIPFDLREKVWILIKKLCEGGDPTPEYEAEYGGSNMSPVDMSINTTRGKAIHGLFHYLLWVDQNVNKDISKEKQKHSIPPEAIPILERLFDTSMEPTVTIRSVVGWYILWLAIFDLDYIRGKLDLIIPQESSLTRFRNAAFEGYFSFNRPDGFLFKNLKQFLIKAFDWANEEESERAFHRPKQHYVAHLAAYYWWGIDPLSDDNCLIKKVFTNGNVKLRSHAIKHIGRSFETLLPVVPGGPEALKRLKELFNWRLTELKKSDVSHEEQIEEMKEFGWWFTYAQMEKEWLLDILLDVLSITDGLIEWTHEVLRRLIDFISVDQLKVANAIDMIVRADPSPWNIEYWQEQLHSIFKAIKESDNHDAWDICKTTINYLGERGYRSYGTFLEY